MINNFDLIRPLLRFDNDGDFYMTQVIKRRKDNPGLPRDMKWLNTYFHTSVTHFDEYCDSIINLCNLENARAYIRLNRRNEKKIAVRAGQKILDLITQEQWRAVKGAYESMAGTYHSEPDRKWVVDVDTKDENELKRISLVIRDLMPDPGIINKIITVLPTPNGWHLVCKPFHAGDFAKLCPDVGIQKDNPTLLYYP